MGCFVQNGTDVRREPAAVTESVLSREDLLPRPTVFSVCSLFPLAFFGDEGGLAGRSTDGAEDVAPGVCSHRVQAAHFARLVPTAGTPTTTL